MKIVIIGCRDLSRVGGIESYMLEFCTCLVRKGHDVKLFVGSDCNKTEIINGIDVINVKVPNNKYINKLLIGYKSSKLALKLFPDADIYHFNANVAGLFSVKLIRKNMNVVFHGHGFEWKRTKWNPIVRKLNKKLDSYVLNKNKNILMCSQEQVEYVKNNYTNKNLMFAPGGVCFPPKLPTKDQYISNDNSYILFLGRVVAEKRVDLLLKAFSEIKNHISQDLYVVGPIEDELIIDKYKDDNRIKFLGPKTGDDKYSLLMHCHSYVIPSDLEGLSISLLEAMSYSKVCIASDIQANKEALSDTGVYFKAGDYSDLKDKLLSVCMKTDDYSYLGTMASERIGNTFTWEKLTDNILEYYSKIIK